jgi:hypothetical protein
MADDCKQFLVGFVIVQMMHVPLRTVLMPETDAESIS